MPMGSLATYPAAEEVLAVGAAFTAFTARKNKGTEAAWAVAAARIRRRRILGRMVVVKAFMDGKLKLLNGLEVGILS